MPQVAGAYWAEADFVFKRGDDIIHVFTFKRTDPDNPGQNIPIDVSDWTFRAQLRSTVTSDVDYPFDITVDGPNGTVSMQMDRAVTETLDPGRYVWDFETTNSDDLRMTRMDGKVRVVADVTR